MLNRIILMGRLTRDPELRRTQAGIPVVSFRLAVDRDFKDKTTGEKATETICEQLAIQPPKVGQSVPFTLCGKNYRLYRMPSSSRAYPLALEKKTAVYRTLVQELGYHI